MSIKKQKESHDKDYRCERCWSKDKINLFPRSHFVDDDANGFVILCEKCKDEAPKEKDEIKFDKLFLRFASLKEFIQNYDAENEKEAMQLWYQEMERKETMLEDASQKSENEMESKGVEPSKKQIGYDLINDALNINKNQAELVREIFNMYLSGKTMEKISREIRKNERSEKWSLNEVREILKDPTYAGYKFRGTEIIKGEHEAIIDTSTFNKVQQKIQRNIRNPKYRQKPLVLED